MTREGALEILRSAELIVSADEVANTVVRLAAEITAKLGEQYPLVLSVMGGAVVFTGQLLPRLRFPLDFDYVHVTRYGDAVSGGQIRWIAAPHSAIVGRSVLVVDDILDEGVTLAAIRDRVMEAGARACHTAVFADKDLGRPKPIRADFVGVRLPDRFVFGFGMDIGGAWRNLPAIYAARA
jgi:hypoxanthine phosphoribosyltransferase